MHCKMLKINTLRFFYEKTTIFNTIFYYKNMCLIKSQIAIKG